MSGDIRDDQREHAADHGDVAPPVQHPADGAAAFAAEQRRPVGIGVFQIIRDRQESTMAVSPSISTGTFSELCGAIASFSVKRHGIDCADSPLCASAIRVRQQYGLNGRASSVPTSSNSFMAIAYPSG